MTTIEVLPAVLDYTVYRGDDFADTVTIKEGSPLAPVDVSGRVYTAQVRRTPDATAIAATFVIDMTNAATGVVGFSIPDTVMATLAGSYTWDFQQSTGGVVRSLMGGKFKVKLDTTRAV